MSDRYESWARTALSEDVFPRDDARSVLSSPDIDLLRLVAAAGEVRMHTFGRKVKVHQINNIKNGLSRLKYANANVIGIVLNQVDTKKQAYYGGNDYYGGYYDSYGYSSKQGAT